VPDGWLGLVGSVEEEIEFEAAHSSHPLHGVCSQLFAWNAEDPNTFLVATDRPDMPVAFVHLTGQFEADPKWPYCVGYPSLDAFRTAWERTGD